MCHLVCLANSLTCPVKPNVKVFLTLKLAVISLMNGNVCQTSAYSDQKKKKKRFNGRKQDRTDGSLHV